MNISFSSLSKCGGDKANEDAVLCLEQNGKSCFVVADGLGGYQKGDVAALMLTDAFTREFHAARKNNLSFLSGGFATAQATILASQETRTEMRTTGVALSIDGHRFAWGHIGDSRLYHFRGNRLVHRTIDHSVAQMLALAGDISDADIARHPERNLLLRAVGDPWEEPCYELSKVHWLVKKDAFLLCSDGFWEHIAEDDIRLALADSANADKWLDTMLALVEKNRVGGHMDDYTAITVTMR